MSFPLAIAVYRIAFNIAWVGLLHFLGLFIILGIGADDIYVVIEFWRQARDEPEATFGGSGGGGVHSALMAEGGGGSGGVGNGGGDGGGDGGDGGGDSDIGGRGEGADGGEGGGGCGGVGGDGGVGWISRRTTGEWWSEAGG